MSEGGGSLEASMIFEKLFTDYLKGQSDDGLRKLLIRKFEMMKREQPILKDIQIGEDGLVSISIRDGDSSQTVITLSRRSMFSSTSRDSS